MLKVVDGSAHKLLGVSQNIFSHGLVEGGLNFIVAVEPYVKGVNQGAALIAPEAQSTYDEALNLRRLAQQRGWRSLIVVTDPVHTRRAVRTFSTLLPGVRVHVSAAPDPRFEPGRWWRSEHGLVAVFNELLKLGFYGVEFGCPPAKAAIKSSFSGDANLW